MPGAGDGPPPPPPHAARTSENTSAAARFVNTAAFRRVPDCRKNSMSASNTHRNQKKRGPFQSGRQGTPSDRAVVATDIVACAAPDAATCTLELENEQAVPAGASLQASDTGTLKPFIGVIVSV